MKTIDFTKTDGTCMHVEYRHANAGEEQTQDSRWLTWLELDGAVYNVRETLAELEELLK